jgi:hypothetical protein
VWRGGGLPILTKAADGIKTARGFAEAEQWRFELERPSSRLPPGELDEELGIGAAIHAVGRATMHDTTVAVVSEHAGHS